MQLLDTAETFPSRIRILSKKRPKIGEIVVRIAKRLRWSAIEEQNLL